MLEENALLEALRSGNIAGAGFDVYPKESLPKDYPHLTRIPQLKLQSLLSEA